MAEYTGPMTDNEADVISTLCGRTTPDTFGTGDQQKFGTPHAKDIDNSLDRYRGETPEGWC